MRFVYKIVPDLICNFICLFWLDNVGEVFVPMSIHCNCFLFLREHSCRLSFVMGAVVADDGPSGVKAPDGGWGWAVLFGCFIITGFSYAFPKAVSVFFKELIREFGIGYSDTAWISSILLAMLYGTGR